jgi:hypothetical protein
MKNLLSLAPGAYNSSYSGGRDKKDPQFKANPGANSSPDPISGGKKPPQERAGRVAQAVRAPA